MTVIITQLISYPIKSCAGIKHQQATLHTMGLATDRQLMLVDEHGLFLSQRKQPLMALIQPEFSAQGLSVKAPGMEPLTLDFQRTIDSPLAVTIWNDSLQADSLHREVNQWFSDYLKLAVKLVKYGAQSHRPIDPDYVMNGETVAFADGYPLLVAHEATLNQLNQYLQQPVAIDRFRPNIVVNSHQACTEC